MMLLIPRSTLQSAHNYTFAAADNYVPAPTAGNVATVADTAVDSAATLTAAFTVPTPDSAATAAVRTASGDSMTSVAVGSVLAGAESGDHYYRAC